MCDTLAPLFTTRHVHADVALRKILHLKAQSSLSHTRVRRKPLSLGLALRRGQKPDKHITSGHRTRVIKTKNNDSTRKHGVSEHDEYDLVLFCACQKRSSLYKPANTSLGSTDNKRDTSFEWIQSLGPMSLRLQLREASELHPKTPSWSFVQQRKRCAKPRKGGIVAKERKPPGWTPHRVMQVVK